MQRYNYALPCKYKTIKKIDGLCNSNTFSVLTHEGLYGIFVGSGTNVIAVPTIYTNVYKSFGRDIVAESEKVASVFNLGGTSFAQISISTIKHILKSKDGGVYFCSNDSKKIDRVIYSNGKGEFSNETDYEYVYRVVKYANLSFADLSETFINSLKVDDSYLGKLRDISDASSGVEESIGFDFGGKLEVKSDGNIYTYNVAFEGKDKSIYFFVSGGDGNDYLWQTNIGDEIYSDVQINMNAIKINNKIESLRNCFWDLNLQKAQVITPKSYYITKSGKYILSYVVKYSDDVPEVVYTLPKYVVMGGQLVEVNSGVNYIEKFKDVGYLSIIDPNTMKVEKTIRIKGSTANYLRSYKGNGYYCYQGYSPRDFSTVFADHQRPLYKLNDDLSIEYKIEIDAGESIVDFIEIDRTLYLCGATVNKGYVGYLNPLLIAINLDTKKVKKIGSKLQNCKDKYFREIEGVIKGNLLITHIDGKKEYIPLSDIE